MRADLDEVRISLAFLESSDSVLKVDEFAVCLIELFS